MLKCTRNKRAFWRSTAVVLCILLYGSNMVIKRCILSDFRPKPAVSSMENAIGDNMTIGISKYTSLQPLGQVWVAYEKPLKERLLLFNLVLIEIRNRLIHEQLHSARKSNITWPGNSTTTVLYNKESDFLAADGGLTDQSTTAVTVFLRHIGSSASNLAAVHSSTSQSSLRMRNTDALIGEYQTWNTLYPLDLCPWIKDKFENLPLNPGCVPNEHTTANFVNVPLQPLETDHLSKRLGLYVQHQDVLDGPSVRASLTYIHVIQRGTVTRIGDVFGSSYKIVPPSCAKKDDLRAPNFDRRQFCVEVFVISQFWGAAYAHRLLENLPRLSPYLHFLRTYPNIRIHVINRNRRVDIMFEALGLDPNRIVTGIVHASVVYLPRSTPCNSVLMLEGQLLSKEFEKYINGTLNQLQNQNGVSSWNTVVLNENFVQGTAAAEAVQKVALKHGFVVKFFSDKELPSMYEVMKLFFSARVIISPHGDGLANMIFSRPGTHVIEAMCPPPYTSVRYIVTAYRLGHFYHAIPALESCSEDYAKPLLVNLQYLGDTLEQILTQIKIK